MKKRGQGLSLNTIIIASLVIVVFSVILLIFTFRAGLFSEDLQQCKTSGGKCMLKSNCDSAIVPSECGDIVQYQVIAGWHWMSIGDEFVCCLEGVK